MSRRVSLGPLHRYARIPQTRSAWRSFIVTGAFMGSLAMWMSMHVSMGRSESEDSVPRARWVESPQPDTPASASAHSLLPAELPVLFNENTLVLPDYAAAEVPQTEPPVITGIAWADSESEEEIWNLPQEDEIDPPQAPAVKSRAARPRARSSLAEAPASEVCTAPAYRIAPKPPYPAAMRSSRAEGAVRLRIYLDAQGTPQRVEVVESSGYDSFDSSASSWVLSRWRFSPAMRGGIPVPGVVVTQVRFVLR